MPTFLHRYSPARNTKFHKEYTKYRSQIALIAMKKVIEALKPLVPEVVGFFTNNQFEGAIYTHMGAKFVRRLTRAVLVKNKDGTLSFSFMINVLTTTLTGMSAICKASSYVSQTYNCKDLSVALMLMSSFLGMSADRVDELTTAPVLGIPGSGETLGPFVSLLL